MLTRLGARREEAREDSARYNEFAEYGKPHRADMAETTSCLSITVEDEEIKAGRCPCPTIGLNHTS